MIITDHELDVIRDALRDAVDYRQQLAASCPRDCIGHGRTCEDCAEHQDAAEAYARVDGELADAVDLGPPPRPENVIQIRGNAL
jgi:hypothetical protein